MDSSNYIRRQYVQAHHYCRKYIVHSNILRLSEWTLNVPPINLLSFSILFTILVVLKSYCLHRYGKMDGVDEGKEGGSAAATADALCVVTL